MKKLFLLLFVTILVVSLSGCGNARKSYEQTKSEVVRYLDENQDDLTEIANEIIHKKSADSASHKDIKNIGYSENEAGQFVTFAFDAQGMLGGQYWGFYYSENDTFDTSVFLTRLDDNRYYYREEDGNNFFASERLADHWFFYYYDYDGNVHGLSWGTKGAL